jgi:type IV pilus assembly protein PilO
MSPMKRARGKEIYIITGIVAVVIAVAWYFLLLSPTRDEIAEKTMQVETAQTTLNAARQQVVRLETYKKTAPQSRAEIVRLGKMLPESEGIPSLIIGLSKTASTAGVELTSITRGESKAGAPFGIQSVNLQVSGRYFDVEDFLHRLESYVAFRNADFRVTGRLLQVTSVTLSGAASAPAGSSASPALTANVVIDAYLWGGSTSGATAAGGTT